MVTWNDVRRICRSLPEVTEGVSRDTAHWQVRDKSFAWERPLRASDLAALGKSAPKGPIVAVRVPSLLAKEAVPAANKACFTTPHFNGYPAVLIQLDKIKVGTLKPLIVEAWLARAPKTLAKAYDRA